MKPLRATSFPHTGQPVDFRVLCAGDALNLAISATRRQGRVLELGLASVAEVPFNLNAAMSRSISIFMSVSSEYSSWDRALALMASGNYDPAALTSLYSLDDWEKAFHDVEKRSVVKAIITPGNFSILDETK